MASTLYAAKWWERDCARPAALTIKGVKLIGNFLKSVFVSLRRTPQR